MPIVPNQSTSSWGNPSIWAGRKAQWRGECSGSILWRAHIIHSHLDFTEETQPASGLNPPSNHLQLLFFSVCVYLYFTLLSLFINLLSICCDCQRVSWHAGWLARGSSFSADCLPEEGWGWLTCLWWELVHTGDVGWQDHRPRCFCQSVHKDLTSFQRGGDVKTLLG